MKARAIKMFSLLALGAALLITMSKPDTFRVPPPTVFRGASEMTLISHAGAGLPEGAYSNSLEALNRAYSHGLRSFEVDVHLTSDGHPVLLHDWEAGLRKWYELPAKLRLSSFLANGAAVATLQEFKALSMRHDLTKLDLNGLAGWMESHPDTIINLNVKQEPLRVLASFMEAYPHLGSRTVVEVYDLAEYPALKSLGYDKLLWVADAYDNATIQSTAQSLDFYAITVRLDDRTLALAKKTSGISTPLWIYTVNSAEHAMVLQQAGVAGIYTDSLIGTQSSAEN